MDTNRSIRLERARWTCRLLLAALTALAWSCQDCRRSSDCAIGKICKDSQCVSSGTQDDGQQNGSDSQGDADADSDGDGDADSDTSPSPSCIGKSEADACEDDGNPCTFNSCSASLRCEALPLTTIDGQVSPCPDDKNSCTEDICWRGECGYSLDGDDCGTDSDPCAKHLCSEKKCIALPLNEGSPCGEASWCKGTSECRNGTCTPNTGSIYCATPNPCLKVLCTEPAEGQTLGKCDYQQLSGTACENGLYCDGKETCDKGACLSGMAPCNDTPRGECEQGICKESDKSCDVIDAEDGTWCADELRCNGQETCQKGACAGGIPFCEKYQYCSEYTCTENNGAEPTCFYSIFDDGDPCDPHDPCAGPGDHQCVAGECAFGNASACGGEDADGNFCTRYEFCSSPAGEDPECNLAVDTKLFAGPILSCAPGGGGDAASAFDFSTVRATNEAASYTGCGSGYDGGDRAYEIQAAAGQAFTVTLSISASTGTAPLSLLLVSNACDADGTCVSSAQGTLKATMPATGKRYVIIDGKDNNRGSGKITITCP